MEYPSIDTAPAGSIRFNTETNKLEVCTGIGTTSTDIKWWKVDSTSPEEQTGGTRMLVSGGWGASNRISCLQIETTGHCQDFGDQYVTRYGLGGTADRTRGVFLGGRMDPSPGQSMGDCDYVTIASFGNAQDFGDLTSTTRESMGSCSDRTRGVVMGGKSNGGILDTIQYITIQSKGNTKPFGDLNFGRGKGAGLSSPTRGINFTGDAPNHTTYHNNISYITISSTGDSADFGDATQAKSDAEGGANAIRGIFASGATAPSTHTNVIEYIQIATLGNAVDFGDITSTAVKSPSVASSPIRVVHAAGATPASPWGTTAITWWHIATTGNSIDFGDLLDNSESGQGISNGHGGLG